MTISWQASGGITYPLANATSMDIPYPTGIVSNNILLMAVGMKPQTAGGGAATAPAGWTLRGETIGGGYGATLGADTGDTKLFVWTRVADGSETGSVTVTLSDNNAEWGQVIRVQSNVGGTGWGYAFAEAEDISAGDISVTFTTNPGIASGDWCWVAMCIPTDVNGTANFSAGALAATGATIGAATEISERATTNGNDIAGSAWFASVTAGTASAAPTFTATGGTTQTNLRGPLALLRLRETSGTDHTVTDVDEAGLTDADLGNTVGQVEVDSAGPTDSTVFVRGEAFSDSAGLTDSPLVVHTPGGGLDPIVAVDNSSPTDQVVIVPSGSRIVWSVTANRG